MLAWQVQKFEKAAWPVSGALAITIDQFSLVSLHKK